MAGASRRVTRRPELVACTWRPPFWRAVRVMVPWWAVTTASTIESPETDPAVVRGAVGTGPPERLDQPVD